MERQYKESAIEWIGQIPENWKIERLKYLFSERNERDCKGRTLLSVSQYYGIRPKSETDLADSHIAESYDDYKEVYQGDFVMNIMLAWNGSYAVSDYDGMVSPAYCVFKFRKDCCKKYFHYLLRTDGYPSAFKTMSRGVIDSRLRLYPEQFYTFPVVIPPVDEQHRISDYLDIKCSEIDGLIELQEQMIAQLTDYKQSVITETVTKGINLDAELVSSGIDWIGEVPKSWMMKRLKFLCTIQTGNQDTQDSDPAGIYPFYVCSPIVERSNKASFEGEGILMAGDGAGAGRVFHHVFGKYAVHQRVYRLANIKGINSYYLFYFLSSLFCKEMDRGSAQSTVPSVRLPMLQNFSICIPSTEEQNCIVDFLDKKCLEIDNLIAVKQQKIETLKEYKKSIIFECVTGKKEIH